MILKFILYINYFSFYILIIKFYLYYFSSFVELNLLEFSRKITSHGISS